MLALALLPGAVFAASAPTAPPVSPSPPAAQRIDDLTEIVVTGTKPTRKSSTILTWMRRLLGQFAYSGYVDLHGKGITEDMRRVQGIGDCVGFGIAPGVQCEIKVTWPESKGPDGEEIFGGISNLSPAMMLFGFEPDDLGIRYMLVDSQGVAEGGLGLLTGDTFMAKEPCVGTPGNCQRIMRIYARPDGKVVQMQIDFEKDAQRVVSFTFVMNRISQAQAQPEVPGKKPPPQARPPMRPPARAPQGPGPGGTGGGGRGR
jgi:hypothetical protein